MLQYPALINILYLQLEAAAFHTETVLQDTCTKKKKKKKKKQVG